MNDPPCIGPVVLVDCDPQDSLSAVWWLELAEVTSGEAAGLLYSKASPGELLAVLAGDDNERPRVAVLSSKGGSGKTAVAVSLATRQAQLNGLAGPVAKAFGRPLLIVDTSPRLEDDALRQIAAVVDLVLVPGAIDEFGAILQTVRTLRERVTTPVKAVITRTTRQVLASVDGQEILGRLADLGVPVVGALHQNRGLAQCLTYGWRPPNMLPAERRARWVTDIDGILTRALPSPGLRDG